MSDDPIQDKQQAVLEGLLGRPLSSTEFEGFLIVGNRFVDRFVDRFGGTRIGELGCIFSTDSPEGKVALAASLVVPSLFQTCERNMSLDRCASRVSRYIHDERYH